MWRKLLSSEYLMTDIENDGIIQFRTQSNAPLNLNFYNFFFFLFIHTRKIKKRKQNRNHFPQFIFNHSMKSFSQIDLEIRSRRRQKNGFSLSNDPLVIIASKKWFNITFPYAKCEFSENLPTPILTEIKDNGSTISRF